MVAGLGLCVERHTASSGHRAGRCFARIVETGQNASRSVGAESRQTPKPMFGWHVAERGVAPSTDLAAFEAPIGTFLRLEAQPSGQA
eukprot:3537920-Prymnesium_polylepis.2